MISHKNHGEIEFRYVDTHAREVSLVGDFNDWDSSATPMRRASNGEWVASLWLADGVYSYKFVADGRYELDSAAFGVEEVPFACNSVLVLNPSRIPALPVG